MFIKPARQEIDNQTIKFSIGAIALTLAVLTGFFADDRLTSISASYWQFDEIWYRGWSQTIFIGFLFAIAGFLLCYNGRSRTQMILAKIAALAAAGVALFPCSCGDPRGYPIVHYTAATVMFAILAIFSFLFYDRAKLKRSTQAKVRARIYALCCLIIVLSIAAMAYDSLTNTFTNMSLYFTFYGEAAALSAFGVSWLLAGRVLPWITAEAERIAPFGDKMPTDE